MAQAPKVYITGASCSGVTTLGRGLAWALRQEGIRHAVPHIDIDDVFWLPTDPPFTAKRPAAERLRLVREALGEGGWVLSGAFDGWGDPLIEDVGLVCFVVTPTPLRMARLRWRERERFGDRILEGGDMHAIHTAFAAWAEGYDEPSFPGRSRARHEAWLARQPAPVLRLDGTRPAGDLVAEALRALETG